MTSYPLECQMIHNILLANHVEMYLICESTLAPAVGIIHASCSNVYKMQGTLPIPYLSTFSTTSHEIPSTFQVTSTQYFISIPELNGLLIRAKPIK